MTHTLRKSVLVGAVVAIAIFGVATIASANHAWGKYHWALSTTQSEANPIKLGDNLTTAAWKGSLSLASDDWNLSVIKNQVAPGTSDANCSPTLGQVEVCNGAYGNNGWLGIAQIWAYRGKDGHIAQGVVQLNDTYFNKNTYNTSSWRNLVMCQEVGHTFGLGHQDENFSNTNLGTCMDYTNDPDGTLYSQLNNERPNAHDYSMLASIYAHHNSTTGGTGGGKGKPAGLGTNIDLQNPSEWGDAVRQDAQGKNSLFVRNLGNGLELITHVTWVPDAPEHDSNTHD